MSDSSDDEYYRKEEDVDEGLDWSVNACQVLLVALFTVAYQAVRLVVLLVWGVVSWLCTSKANHADTDQS